MYDKNDLKIQGNEILVKEYDGSEINGVPYYVWKTLLTINPQKCIYSLHFTMEKLIKTFY